MRKTLLGVVALILTFSLLAQYSLVASAPSHAATVNLELFDSVHNQEMIRGSLMGEFQRQIANVTLPSRVISEPVIRYKENSTDSPISTELPITKTQNLLFPTEFPETTQFRPLSRDQIDFSNSLIQQDFCDPTFVGGLITFRQSFESTFDDFLNQISSRFGINFIPGPNIGGRPVNIKAENVPWTTLLRSQLFVLGIRATCVGTNTIELISNYDVANIERSRRDAAPLETEFIKLKYLQPTSGGNVDISGQSSRQGSGGQGGCQNSSSQGQQGGGSRQSLDQRCKFERLIIEIEKILDIGQDKQAQTPPEPSEPTGPAGENSKTSQPRNQNAVKPGSVSQIPGRNMLMVTATAEQMGRIRRIIELADRAPFQVVIKGLIYTANEDKLRDIGVQTTITEAGRDRSTGGIFGHTLGAGGTLFDFSTIIGSFDFNVQATALQQNGVISIKSRPFATVLDGDSTELTVGRQVPVLIQATNNLGGTPGTLQILQAANLLSVTPHVIDDENGNPVAVNLELQLESNDVDTSVISQGVPSVSVRSIQSRIILNMEQTAILGGFTIDSDSRSVSKTPGLGDIPILGELFKRRVRTSQINRLYFAISVSVIPYPGTIEPVKVPGATTDIPSITPDMLKRAEKAEPKQVVGPVKTGP